MDAQTAVNRYALDPYGTDTYTLTTVADLATGAYAPGLGTITDVKPDSATPGYMSVQHDVETSDGGHDTEVAWMPGDWAIYVTA